MTSTVVDETDEEWAPGQPPPGGAQGGDKASPKPVFSRRGELREPLHRARYRDAPRRPRGVVPSLVGAPDGHPAPDGAVAGVGDATPGAGRHVPLVGRALRRSHEGAPGRRPRPLLPLYQSPPAPRAASDRCPAGRLGQGQRPGALKGHPLMEPLDHHGIAPQPDATADVHSELDTLARVALTAAETIARTAARRSTKEAKAIERAATAEMADAADRAEQAKAGLSTGTASAIPATGPVTIGDLLAASHPDLVAPSPTAEQPPSRSTSTSPPPPSPRRSTPRRPAQVRRRHPPRPPPLTRPSKCRSPYRTCSMPPTRSARKRNWRPPRLRRALSRWRLCPLTN